MNKKSKETKLLDDYSDTDFGDSTLVGNSPYELEASVSEHLRNILEESPESER
jgi:hypothetical protein